MKNYLVVVPYKAKVSFYVRAKDEAAMREMIKIPPVRLDVGRTPWFLRELLENTEFAEGEEVYVKEVDTLFAGTDQAH